MLKLFKTLALTCALFSAACAAQAQTRAATIDDAAWLAGRWVGEGFGGQMIGHFRHWRDGQPHVYEFMVMDVVEGGVRMRLKHFNPDYTAWEDRETWTTFEPVSVSSDAIIFDGLAIRRESEDRIAMTIRIRDGGTVNEHILRFQRAPL
jgi:hypothetical protein